MDAVALEAGGTLWLIELKDYRQHRRSKPSSLFDEVASKVRATLAGLATARVRANDTDEKRLAQQALGCSQIRIALQVAQADPPSRLFPQVIDPQDAVLALKRAVCAVDAHPVCAVGNMSQADLPWTSAAIRSAAMA